MNSNRRKSLRALSDKLAELRGAIDDAKSELESLRDEETDYRDNMPDSLREGDKGQAADTACDALDSAVDSLDTIISELESAESSISDAVDAS